MTNVSKHPLSEQTTNQLFAQLSTIFAQVDDSVVQALFSELFTEAEQVQFMKRLAIILLLDKKQSTYRIAQLLHVSDATVRRIRVAHELDKYATILQVVRKPAFDTQKFWQTIEVVLRGGLPPQGRDRWKGILV